MMRCVQVLACLLVAAAPAAADPVVLGATAEVVRLETVDFSPVPYLWDTFIHGEADGPAFHRAVTYPDSAQGGWLVALAERSLDCSVHWLDKDPDDVLWGTVGLEAGFSVVVGTDRETEFRAVRETAGTPAIARIAVSVRDGDGGEHALLIAGTGPDSASVRLPAGIHVVSAEFVLTDVNGHHACAGALSVGWSAACIPVRAVTWSEAKAAFLGP
ncbi:MAG: hypothetical protein R6X35_00350 [Candidatus Krumholzibacteriia bacterium]